MATPTKSLGLPRPIRESNSCRAGEARRGEAALKVSRLERVTSWLGLGSFVAARLDVVAHTRIELVSRPAGRAAAKPRSEEVALRGLRPEDAAQTDEVEENW